MPVRLHLDFYGDQQVDRTLDRFEARALDARPAWEAMADLFLVIERRQFATEGRYGSGGWAPLSPRYAAWKARHFPGKTILRRTDELFTSLTEGPQIRIIEPGFMVLGSAVPYGKYHQLGDGLPRRRPVELPESDRRTFVRMLQRFIVTGQAPTVGPRGGVS